MPGLYLYCVTPAGHSPPADLGGLGEAPVHAVSAAGLAVWVSEIESGTVDIGIESVQRHNAVVEAAVTPEITPVPLRFGQRLADAAEVRLRIAGQREHWQERLEQFAGALEFGVRVLDPRPRPAARDVRGAPPAGGRAYLEQLARRHAGERGARAEAERVAEELRQAVGTAAVCERVELLRGGHGVASIAHLVPRVHFARYRENIGRARAALPTFRLLVSGPWPPYSFAA